MNIKNMNLLAKIDWLIKQVNGLSNQIFPPAYYPITIAGTVSTVGGTKNVIGVGTSFTSELILGQSIEINGELQNIADITDDTNLITTNNIVGTYSGVPLVINSPPLSVTSIGVGIGMINPGVALDIVGGVRIQGNPLIDGTSTFRGNANFFLNTNAVFLNSVYTTVLKIDATEARIGINTPSPTAVLDINADTMRLRTAKTPASAGASGTQGDISWDANYVYVCVATDTWKRSAIATW
jgi:hypothetical protein